MKYLFSIFICYILFGCSSIKVKEQLPGGYVLLDFIEEDGLAISATLGGGSYIDVVTNCVFEIGYNEEFIIAKQHPCEFGKEPNIFIVNYYIVPIKNKISESQDLNKIGPLSYLQFLQKRKEIGVQSDLDFTSFYEGKHSKKNAH